MCKQKHRGFPEDKNSNIGKVLICEFRKKLIKVIRQKAKANSNPEISISLYTASVRFCCAYLILMAQKSTKNLDK